MSKLFKRYATDTAKEQKGVWVEYDDTRFLICRAGGANRKYREVLTAKIKPLKHQIERDMLPEEDNKRLTAEVFAESVVLSVEVKDEAGSWTVGVPTESGEVVEFTPANVTALFLALPDLFTDLTRMANDAATFQRNQEADDLKNSVKS